MKLRYAIPIFRTESRLLIKREAPGRTNDKFDDIFSGGSFQNVFNEMQLLKSRPLAARVAKVLNLQYRYYNKGNIRNSLLYNESPVGIEVLNPDSTSSVSVTIVVTDDNHFKFEKEEKQHSFGETINIGGTNFKVIKFLPNVYNLYSSNVYILRKGTIADVANEVAGNLKVTLVDNFAQIINLTYESENPAMAGDILNTLMEVYKSSNIEDKRQTRISTLQFIDERLDSLRIELGFVEKDLAKYVESNKAFQLDKQSENYLERLNNESTSIAQQEVRLSIIDWLIRYLSNPENEFKAVPVELGTQESTLVPLISEYNRTQIERKNALMTMPATNPFIISIDDRIRKLRTDIIEALQNVRQSYVIQSSSLRKQNLETESRLQSIPSKTQQLAEKSRQQKIKEELYLFLLQKKEENAIASASTISDSKVVEPARNENSPISPNSRSIYLTAIVLGLLVPIGGIFLKEYLNDKINSRVDIEKATTTPYIGDVGHSEDSEALIVSKGTRRFIAEQFRIIRTNLQFIVSKTKNPVILVTSSFSGEGKSFVSTNMGAVMALTGKKTLIMELDIRKPKIVSNLSLKKQAGITNYLVGKANIEDLILKVPGIENLYVMPCGPVPPNPAEMLLDEKINGLFAYVRANFDVTIVDTAPVGLVSDALVIGRHADCTLYILRQAYTFKRQIGLIDELYKNNKLPRLSLLLNDVKFT
ncbi:MAG TPA: polysaccharide biosynthesis tyrosine autokinase, partial [Chitinophagaceae bacterium]|nr:polysaccharide biosynthesis tyrosine autokinase [Chitinophagaceae bacterium]